MSRLVIAFFFVLLSLRAQDVLTGQYDSTRQSWQQHETQLTPASIAQSNFHFLGSYTVNGDVYGQPLYASNVTVNGAPFNLLIAADDAGYVYAFDADRPGSAALWTSFLIAPRTTYPGPGTNTYYGRSIGCPDDPVIDKSGGYVYVACTNTTPTWTLYKLNLVSGATISSVTLTGSVTGTGDPSGGDTVSGGVLTFYPAYELCRTPLTLAGGKIYVGCSAYADTHPWHGWVFEVDASTLAINNVWCSTPNGGGGGIWEGAGGPAVDGSGNLLIATGNGLYDGAASSDYSMSVVKLSSALTLSDWFTPTNYSTLSSADADISSGRTMTLPGGTLTATGAKDGKVYVIDSAGMGHLGLSGTDQTIVTNSGITPSDVSGIYGGAFGNGTLYMPNTAGSVYAFTVSGSTFTAKWTSALTFPFPGLQMAVSSNGTSNDIIWGTAPTSASAETAQAAGTLYALNPTTGAKIWSSDDHAGDTLGTLAKYAAPTIANGRVYVATQSNKIPVYGINAGRSSGSGTP